MALLKVFGQIRINSIQTGTTRWREGNLEVVERDNKASLLVRFKCGGPTRTFQLSRNVKTVKMSPAVKQETRLMLTLQDKSSLTIDKAPSSQAQLLVDFLEDLSSEKLPSGMKLTPGSGSFGGTLGKRIPSKESHRQLCNIENQTPVRREEAALREEAVVRKSPAGPSRAGLRPPVPVVVTVPGNSRSGSQSPSSYSNSRNILAENRSEKRKRLPAPEPETAEDYPKENDSSSNNQAWSDTGRRFLSSSRDKQLSLRQAEDNKPNGPLSLPVPSASFYGSKASARDYTTGNSVLDRTSLSSQNPSVKKTPGFLPQPSPQSAKRLRLNQDYAGWNKLRVQPSTQQPQQLQGFSNLGNTCYMNAILQSLFSLQSLSIDLLKQGIPWNKIPTNALLKRFAHLLAKKDNCSPEMKKELLKKVKHSISATAERFSGYMQNDAHEFLSQCLDQLKEDMERLNKSWRNEQEPGGEGPAAHTKLYTCPIVSNVEFEVLHSISCKMCCETVTKREQFNDLSIDLPRRRKSLPPRSIQDSLDLFFRAEEIEYACEKCQGKAAVVTHKFSRLPRVLILHLKRYSYSVELSVSSKVGQQVKIPKYLSLQAHCSEGTREPLALASSSQGSAPQPLKTSQSLNSCTALPSTLARKYSFKPAVVLLDSDSEEEQLRRAMSLSRQLNEQTPDTEPQTAVKGSRQEAEGPGSGLHTVLDGLTEEEVLAVVLEMSRRESVQAGSSEREDKPSSSPDTGFGEDEAQEFPEQPVTMEPEAVRSSAHPEAVSVGKDGDENKENKTPDGWCEGDWLQQYQLDREREEQELQQALAQSLQEQEARDLKEDDDLKRATELSLQECNSSFGESLGSDEDSGNEDGDFLDVDFCQNAELKRCTEMEELSHSYRLISVVSHIGSSSSSGHYISDVFDIKKQTWLTYNDLEVSRTAETSVQSQRQRNGYIFFYMCT
uniref:Ubiquitin carboxyl-terminal hydrolase n=2 Tax=Callorhinchus milii TaxID=7868 RepID=A0A4W3HK86_CALMI